MALITNSIVGLVAFLHVYFLVLEMFLWDKPFGIKNVWKYSRKGQYH